MSDGTKYTSPEHFVRGVMTAAQKARSNMAEHEVDDLGEMLWPELYTDEWNNVLTVCDRMLAKGRVPNGGDAHNLSFLIHRNPQVALLLDAHPRLASGMEAFPEPDECTRRWGLM